jgi:hypothetical protein
MTDLFGSVDGRACVGCAAWEANRHSGLYIDGCDDCKARRIARSPQAFKALAGDKDHVLWAVEDAFPPEKYEHGLALVRSWIRKLRKS